MLRRLGVAVLRYAPMAAILFALLSLLALNPGAVAGVEPVWPGIGGSLVLLCAVFLARALIWGQLLRAFGFPVSPQLAIVSTNRSLLFKYLPGKVWVILGRAGYVHREAGHPLLPLSALSLMLQVLTVVVGLLLGALGLAMLCCPVAAVALACVFGVALWFLARSRQLPSYLLRWVPGERLRLFLGRAPMPPLAGIVGGVAAQWLGTGLAYWLFFAACSVQISWLVILLQPAANAAGIAAVFAPGGMGVREGIAAAYLVKLGISVPLALALGVVARLWFFAAELLIFAHSYLMSASPADRPAAPQNTLR